MSGSTQVLTAKYGAAGHVPVADPSSAFIEVAIYLAKRARLDDCVAYDCADALALPHENQCIDLARTQHATMNIADRPHLYAETHRAVGADFPTLSANLGRILRAGLQRRQEYIA